MLYVPNCFYFVSIATWNNVQTDTAHKLKTDWHIDRNSQLANHLACNLLIAESQTSKSQAHILILL